MARVLPLPGSTPGSGVRLPGARVPVGAGGGRYPRECGSPAAWSTDSHRQGVESDHRGELAWLERVVSPEPVLTPRLLGLVEAVARRWVGMRSDVLRLAIPPRHAAAERSVPAAEPPLGVTTGPVELPTGWADHPMAARFLEAVVAGIPARAVWTVPPGRDWASALRRWPTPFAAGPPGSAHRPDQRDVDRLTAACRDTVGRAVGRDWSPTSRPALVRRPGIVVVAGDPRARPHTGEPVARCSHRFQAR